MKKANFFALAILLASPVSAVADEESHAVPQRLLQELDRWLDTETEFDRRPDTPDILFIDPARVGELSGVHGHATARTRGLYDEATGTIYLTRPWSPDNPRDLSVLLHELVHHRQAVRHWYCPEAQEWRAYQIQAQWLAERNIPDEFYWPAIVLQSSCAPRDIHPE